MIELTLQRIDDRTVLITSGSWCELVEVKAREDDDA